MSRYLMLRIASLIPVLWLVSLFVFIVSALLPGDPAAVLLGTDATPEQLATARRAFGLDEPLPLRYVRWLAHVVRGDLGVSFFSQQPVVTLIERALPVTLQLIALATCMALALSVPAAVIAATRRDSWFDLVTRFVAFSGQSVPSFWFGILLISFFAVRLHLLPASGYVPLRSDLLGWFKSLLLPSLTLGAILAAGLTRYLRAGLLDVLGLEYVTSARAKGLTEWAILVRHVLRNALIPFTTVFGLSVAGLVGGAIVIEQVFAIPGMGRLGLEAILARDYRVIQGVVLVTATSFVLINFFVDILYGVLDPRLRAGGER